MAEFPSAEWLAGLVGAGGQPGPSLEVQLVVSGGPGGDVSMRVRLADGVVVQAELGAASTPDIVLTANAADASAMAAGDLDPSVAFMQGRMKTSGDPGLVLELLAHANAHTSG